MSDISINTGKFIEIIKNNSTSSIRGLVSPHSIELSKFLFLDDDLDSYLRLKLFADNKEKNDQVSFYYVLASIGLSKKLPDINLDEILKKTLFKNKDYKKALVSVNNFINKPDKKYLDNINGLNLLDYEINLCLYFCFYYTQLDDSFFSIIFSFFDEYFIFNKDETITLNSDKDINNLIDENGLLLICLLTKCYKYFNINIFNEVSLNLISKSCFNVFIIDKYFSYNTMDKDLIFKTSNYLNNYLSFLPQRFALLISHYLLLNSYIHNDYNFINNWFSQFSDKIKSGQISNDYDGNFNWEISDNRIEANVYWSSQKNAYFYINSIFSLYKEMTSLNSSSVNNNSKKINVIGGINSLSYLNLNNNDISVNLSFIYTDRYISSHNVSSLNNLDKNFFKETNSLILFVPDIEMFINQDFTLFFNDFIVKLLDNYDSKDVFIQTIANPGLISHPHFKYEKIVSLVNDFNTYLFELEKSSPFKVIDINKYLSSENDYTSFENLICNYYIKPDILNKFLSNELIEK